jgi:antibiotic biosynthesis monooxygenase (ABM) superfamily enzyme
MISCSFIFSPGEYDAEFLELDGKIDEFASSLAGFIGVDRWVSDDGKSRNSIYYFDGMDSVKELSRYPEHLVAKANYKKWYLGYQIVVSEVVGSYGDGYFTHLSQPR